MSNAHGRLGTHTHTHTHTHTKTNYYNVYNPRAHAPSVNHASYETVTTSSNLYLADKLVTGHKNMKWWLCLVMCHVVQRPHPPIIIVIVLVSDIWCTHVLSARYPHEFVKLPVTNCTVHVNWHTIWHNWDSWRTGTHHIKLYGKQLKFLWAQGGQCACIFSVLHEHLPWGMCMMATVTPEMMSPTMKKGW